MIKSRVCISECLKKFDQKLNLGIFYSPILLDHRHHDVSRHSILRNLAKISLIYYFFHIFGIRKFFIRICEAWSVKSSIITNLFEGDISSDSISSITRLVKPFLIKR